jgi:hypothetical protein
MADESEVTFGKCVGAQPKIEQPDPDPMAEFSARYHYEAERRRVDLSRKYGVGFWFALEDKAEDEELERGY